MISKIDSTRNSTPFKAKLNKELAEEIAKNAKNLSEEAVDAFCKTLKEVDENVVFTNYGEKNLMGINFHSTNTQYPIRLYLKNMFEAATPEELLKKADSQKINEAVKNNLIEKDKHIISIKKTLDAKSQNWHKNAIAMGVKPGLTHYLTVFSKDINSSFFESLSVKALKNISEVAKMEDIDFRLTSENPLQDKNVYIMVASNKHRKQGETFLDFQKYCKVGEIETKFTPEKVREFEETQLKKAKEFSDKLKQFIRE